MVLHVTWIIILPDTVEYPLCPLLREIQGCFALLKVLGYAVNETS